MLRIPFSKAYPTSARARAPPGADVRAFELWNKSIDHLSRTNIMTNPKNTTAMTAVGNAPPPAHLLAIKPEDLDHNISDTPSVPSQVLVMRGLSPGVNKHDAAYIPNAEPGDLVIPTLGKVYKGEVGASVQLCLDRWSFPEFLPDRGGLVCVHDTPPGNLEKRGSENGRQQMLVCRDTNNIIEPTINLFLLIEGEPAVMYASRSKIYFAQRWLTAIRQYKHPSGKPFPPCSRCWQIKTALIKRTLGAWFSPTFTDNGWAPKDLFERGQELRRLVESGGMQLAQSVAD
jgi:hypothetical protein